LLQELFNKLDAPLDDREAAACKFVQIKEKFVPLRAYYSINEESEASRYVRRRRPRDAARASPCVIEVPPRQSRCTDRGGVAACIYDLRALWGSLEGWTNGTDGGVCDVLGALRKSD
jgi:hypothetical protein